MSKIMWKERSAASGLVLFLASLLMGGLLFSYFYRAVSLDSLDAVPLDSGPCDHALADASLERRTMSEKESQVLTVTLKNTTGIECEVTVRIIAPKFDLGSDKSEKKHSLGPRSTGSLIWIIAPKDVGAYTIAIMVGVDYLQLGVTVTNIFGLSAWSAQIIFYIGGILGPILTVPWWLDKFSRKRKTK